MTPANQIGNGQMGNYGSPALSTEISSMGAPEIPVEQKPNPQQSKAIDLINRFGEVHQNFKNLQASFPGAETEFSEVENALKNWLVKARDSILNSGGESATY
jgi:hypothetical protein